MNTRNEQTEARLLASTVALGVILADTGGELLESYPCVGRMTVEFHGCYGGGDIIGIDLYTPGADTRPVHPDIVAELMNEVVPGPDGVAITIGKWIDDIVIGLLNHRHPGWAESDGSCGEIELAWTTGDDNRLALAIGGTFECRELVGTEHPFWSDDDISWSTGDAATVGKELANASC